MKTRLMQNTPGMSLPDELPVRFGDRVVGIGRNFRVEDGFVVCDLGDGGTNAAFVSVTMTCDRMLECQIYMANAVLSGKPQHTEL